MSAHGSEVEARKRGREKPKRSRRKRASERAGGREAPGSGEPEVSGFAECEPRYASERGPNARERAGLSAMPEELSTEQYLRAQGHTALVKVGEATLGEDGLRFDGLTTEEAAAELYRRTGRYPPEVLLAMAVAGSR